SCRLHISFSQLLRSLLNRWTAGLPAAPALGCNPDIASRRHQLSRDTAKRKISAMDDFGCFANLCFSAYLERQSRIFRKLPSTVQHHAVGLNSSHHSDRSLFSHWFRVGSESRRGVAPGLCWQELFSSHRFGAANWRVLLCVHHWRRVSHPSMAESSRSA